MDRLEHLEWAKARALEYINAGDCEQAVASMLSDLGKHEDWQGKPWIVSLGLLTLRTGTEKAARDFVAGFN